ncbi:MAG: hypothetical protein ACO2OS_04885 [Thermosphaera aggregans]|jgi:hypothetical protein|uniref:hypothetical protein n=1 Tax=Thermosphaera aggregans TaxID=54254 RepID=UPI003C0CE0C1
MINKITVREKGLQIVREAAPLALVLILTALITVEATWVYMREFSDALGDVEDIENCPVYADIVIIGYGFNETHVGFNITVNGNIPLPSSSVYWYGVFIDSDNDPSTGLIYSAPIDKDKENWANIGADYLLEVWIDTYTESTPGVKLFRYVGNGTSWDVIEVSDAKISASVYGKNVANDTIELVVGKNYLTPLSGEISFLTYVTYGKESSWGRCDAFIVAPGGEGPVPIPEPALLVATSVVIVSALFLLLIKDNL